MHLQVQQQPEQSAAQALVEDDPGALEDDPGVFKGDPEHKHDFSAPTKMLAMEEPEPEHQLELAHQPVPEMLALAAMQTPKMHLQVQQQPEQSAAQALVEDDPGALENDPGIFKGDPEHKHDFSAPTKMLAMERLEHALEPAPKPEPVYQLELAHQPMPEMLARSTPEPNSQFDLMPTSNGNIVNAGGPIHLLRQQQEPRTTTTKTNNPLSTPLLVPELQGSTPALQQGTINWSAFRPDFTHLEGRAVSAAFLCNFRQENVSDALKQRATEAAIPYLEEKIREREREIAEIQSISNNSRGPSHSAGRRDEQSIELTNVERSLLWLQEDLTKRKRNAYVTARDVHRYIIKPMTDPLKCRYCELPGMSERTDPRTGMFYFGLADHFFSYNWDSPFDDVIDAICTHSNARVAEGKAPPYYWVDNFAINQHERTSEEGWKSCKQCSSKCVHVEAGEGDCWRMSSTPCPACPQCQAKGNWVVCQHCPCVACRARSEDLPDWDRKEEANGELLGFERVIRHTRSTLMLMEPWHRPRAPTRVWCLFEGYCTLLNGGKLEAVLGRSQQSLLHMKLGDNFESQASDLIYRLDSRTADATGEVDKLKIFAKIESLDGGHDALDREIQKAMAEWLVQAAEGVIKRTDPYRGRWRWSGDEMQQEVGQIGDRWGSDEDWISAALSPKAILINQMHALACNISRVLNTIQMQIATLYVILSSWATAIATCCSCCVCLCASGKLGSKILIGLCFFSRVWAIWHTYGSAELVCECQRQTMGVGSGSASDIGAEISIGATASCCSSDVETACDDMRFNIYLVGGLGLFTSCIPGYFIALAEEHEGELDEEHVFCSCCLSTCMFCVGVYFWMELLLSLSSECSTENIKSANVMLYTYAVDIGIMTLEAAKATAEVKEELGLIGCCLKAIGCCSCIGCCAHSCSSSILVGVSCCFNACTTRFRAYSAENNKYSLHRDTVQPIFCGGARLTWLVELIPRFGPSLNMLGDMIQLSVFPGLALLWMAGTNFGDWCQFEALETAGDGSFSSTAPGWYKEHPYPSEWHWWWTGMWYFLLFVVTSPVGWCATFVYCTSVFVIKPCGYILTTHQMSRRLRQPPTFGATLTRRRDSVLKILFFPLASLASVALHHSGVFGCVCWIMLCTAIVVGIANPLHDAQRAAAARALLQVNVGKLQLRLLLNPCMARKTCVEAQAELRYIVGNPGSTWIADSWGSSVKTTVKQALMAVKEAIKDCENPQLADRSPRIIVTAAGETYNPDSHWIKRIDIATGYSNYRCHDSQPEVPPCEDTLPQVVNAVSHIEYICSHSEVQELESEEEQESASFLTNKEAVWMTIILINAGIVRCWALWSVSHSDGAVCNCAQNTSVDNSCCSAGIQAACDDMRDCTDKVCTAAFGKAAIILLGLLVRGDEGLSKTDIFYLVVGIIVGLWAWCDNWIRLLELYSSDECKKCSADMLASVSTILTVDVWELFASAAVFLANYDTTHLSTHWAHPFVNTLGTLGGGETLDDNFGIQSMFSANGDDSDDDDCVIM